MPERTLNLLRFNFLACLLLVCLAAGCKAQSNPQGPLDANLTRRVEVMVRSQYNLPADYGVTVGAPQPGNISGYNQLPITISHNGKSQVVDFLLSTDNSKLAKLETFNLAGDPAFNIDIGGRPIRGNPDAKVTVINFDDLECPFCARMHAELFPSTFNRYQNLVRFVYKDFPLTQIHPWAMHAAVDADCLAAQNGEVYWNYVDYLHAHSDQITGQDPNLKRSFDQLDKLTRDEATVSKLDSKQLSACIARQDETQVRKSMAQGDALGIQGAPQLFVNGERIDGAVPEQQVWAVIDRALVAAGETPPPMPASPPAPASAPVQGTPGQKSPAVSGK
ncbi:MAG: DsbA family protein [Terracidiphilus sp.]